MIFVRTRLKITRLLYSRRVYSGYTRSGVGLDECVRTRPFYSGVYIRPTRRSWRKTRPNGMPSRAGYLLMRRQHHTLFRLFSMTDCAWNITRVELVPLNALYGGEGEEAGRCSCRRVDLDLVVGLPAGLLDGSRVRRVYVGKLSVNSGKTEAGSPDTKWARNNRKVVC